MSESDTTREKVSFLQAEGLVPLLNMQQGTSVTKQFTTIAYDVLRNALLYASDVYGSEPSQNSIAIWTGYFSLFSDEIHWDENEYFKHLKKHISDGARLLDILQYCAREKNNSTRWL